MSRNYLSHESNTFSLSPKLWAHQCRVTRWCRSTMLTHTNTQADAASYCWSLRKIRWPIHLLVLFLATGVTVMLLQWKKFPYELVNQAAEASCFYHFVFSSAYPTNLIWVSIRCPHCFVTISFSGFYVYSFLKLTLDASAVLKHGKLGPNCRKELYVLGTKGKGFN